MRTRTKPLIFTAALLTLAIPSIASAGESYTWLPPLPAPMCDGTWNNANCWSPPGVPGAQDSAAVGMKGDPEVDGDISIEQLTLNGTLSGAGTLTIVPDQPGDTSILTLDGGTVSTTLTLGPLALGSITGGGVTITGGKLINQSQLTWTGGNIQGAGDALIDNKGTFHLAALLGGFSYAGGLNSATLQNEGTVIYEVGQTLHIGDFWTVKNSGTFQIPTGTVVLDHESDGDSHFLDGSVISGGGKLLVSDTANYTAADLEGTITIENGMTFEIGAGAEMYGTASITGAGTFVWSGGQLVANPKTTLTIAKDMKAQFSGDTDKTLGAGVILDIEGSVDWTGAGNILGAGQPTLKNNGTFNAKSNAGFAYSSGSNGATLENHGTFARIGDSGTTLMTGHWNVANYGVIDIENGVFQIDENTGQSFLHDGCTFQGVGITRFGAPGATDSGNEITIDGTIHIPSGATLELADRSTLDGLNATFDGAGTYAWTGGQIVGDFMDPVATFGADLALSISGPGRKDMNAAPIITFQGSTTWSGAGSLVMDSGTIHNTGTMVQTGDAILDHNTSGNFQNDGTFRKDGGTGQTQIWQNFTNAGTFEIKTGSVFLNYGSLLTQTDTGVLILDGTELTTSTMSNLGSEIELGGTVQGSGTISTKALTIDGKIQPGGPNVAGKIYLPGNYVQSSTGELDIDLGGKNAGVDFDLLAVDGTSKIDGTLGVDLIGQYVPDVGATFVIHTFMSGKGTFATVAPTKNLGVTTTYDPADVTLGVTFAMANPETGGAGGAGGGAGSSGTGGVAGNGGASAGAAGTGGASAGAGGSGAGHSGSGGASAGHGGASAGHAGTGGAGGSKSGTGGASIANAGSATAGSGGSSGTGNTSVTPDSGDGGGGCSTSGRAPASGAFGLALAGLAMMRRRRARG